MWRTAISRATGSLRSPSTTISGTSFRRHFSSSSSSSNSSSSVVNSMILRSLKDHYTEVFKMTPPPKVSPPSPFSVVKGALGGGGPVLKRTYGDEEISLSVMRMVNILPAVDPSEIDGLARTWFSCSKCRGLQSPLRNYVACTRLSTEQMKNYKPLQDESDLVDPFMIVMNKENHGYCRLYGV